MKRKKLFRQGMAAVICVLGMLMGTVQAAPRKVMVVMSYHEDMPWVKEIREGITDILGSICEIRYSYLDTRNHPDMGKQKTEEALALFRDFQPDGVIAADDNAQSLFVVPYLKDKVKTPVIFCGVNADPVDYGYPAANVSGVLERAHLRESIALILQLDPGVKNMGYMARDSLTAQGMFQVIQSESDTYPARSVSYKLPATLAEARSMAREMRETCDALFLVALEGIPDEQGRPLTEKEVIPEIAKIFGKPTTSPDAFNVKYGLLCAVTKTGQEQGKLASKMLVSAMDGTPVTEIPITQNRLGKRLINVTVMKELGIKPNHSALIGVELVRTGGE